MAPARESLTNATRRDLQLVALFTGLRDANVTTLRWESIDWERTTPAR